MVENKDNDNTLHIPIADRTKNGGTQQLYRFPNGYGASVVRGPYTYGGPEGLFELAVISFDRDESRAGYRLNYDTEITDDVLGYLTHEDVHSLLGRIAALEPVSP